MYFVGTKSVYVLLCPLPGSVGMRDIGCNILARKDYICGEENSAFGGFELKQD